MKLSPIFALLTVCAPIIAHAQTADAPAVAAPGDAVPANNAPAVAAIAPLPMAPKSAAASDAFVWRFEPPVGSRWTMRSFTRETSRSHNPVSDGPTPHETQTTTIEHLTADYDVLSRDALGATTIRLTLRGITLDATEIADGKIVKSPVPENAKFKAVNGATLTIKQSRDGAVWGIIGMRAFQRKILEATSDLDAATINQVLDASPATNNSDFVKSLGALGGGLPTSPIRVGESWNYNVSLPANLPFSIAISGKRTLKMLNAQIAVVADSASYKGGQSAMKIAGQPKSTDVSLNYSQLFGTVSGTSRVQRSSGLPLETTMTQSIKGNIFYEIPLPSGKIQKNEKIPIDITTSSRVLLQPRR